MTDYADIRAALEQKCSAILIDDPDLLRTLLAERDALRRALEWNAGALMAACKAGRISELDRSSSDTETYTVGVILDMAESALARAQEET